MKNYHAIVIGAGMVGLACALALAQKRFRVALVESKPIHFHPDGLNSLLRVSAINCASAEFLKNIGIFDNIPKTKMAPLAKMEVWDNVGGGQIHFDGAELNLPELGFIIPNESVMLSAWNLIQENSNIDFYPEMPIDIINETREIILEFQNQKISAELLIAADGSQSWSRQKMNIEAEIKSYSQSAIVALIETEKPHHFCAYQNFLSTGPIGALPLHNLNQISIVWSADNDYAKILLQMEPEKFNTHFQVALDNKLGKTRLISERKEFPLKALHAKHYCQEKFVLIGDAAHTIHPLAGQGVNLGFKDVEVLINTLLEAKEKGRRMGALRTLRIYERSRKFDNQTMLAAMRGFKVLFGNKNPALIQLRSFGLNTVDQCSPLKKIFMKKAV